jgi:S-adenosylmethionine:diacylglycerol 3-amino-3-carboxypropyl transferase
MKTVGYSGTPLLKKLGMDRARSIVVLNAPARYVEALGVSAACKLHADADVVQFFTKSAAQMKSQIGQLRSSIVPDGAIWISWPKKASKVETDLNENIAREIALAHGLVDVKVCAVDEVWSGLKLVIPVAQRVRR